MKPTIGKLVALAFLVVFSAVVFVSPLLYAAVQSGNPSPGPIGIVSANVAVCDPSNPTNCLAPGAGLTAGQTSGTVAVAATSGVVANTAATASLPSVAGKTTYITGFQMTAGGTTAAQPCVAAFVFNIASGSANTLWYSFCTPIGATVPSSCGRQPI
jgi:hypothetical protein